MTRKDLLKQANLISAPYGLTAELLGNEIKSVGVQGDLRTHTKIILLYKTDGGIVNNDILDKLSSKISSLLPINRVVYQIGLKMNKKNIKPKQPKRAKLSSRLQDNPVSLKITLRPSSKGYKWIVNDWFGVTMAQGTESTYEKAKKVAGDTKRQLRLDALAKIEAGKKKRAEQGEKESTIFEQKGLAFGREFE
jgi:hypothetical protein